MTEVYIVVDGHYSDYRIEAVFSTKELAQGYIDIYNKASKWRGDKRIEEYNLDKPEKLELGLAVRMAKDGRVAEVSLAVIKDNNNVGFKFFDLDTPINLGWIVATKDKERAIKVVNEKRTQILALGIWGDDAKVREIIS